MYKVNNAIELGGATFTTVTISKPKHGEVALSFNGSITKGDSFVPQAILDSNDCRDLGLWLLDLAKKIDKKTDKENS